MSDVRVDQFDENGEYIITTYAWWPEPHDTSDDTLTVEAAADRLEQKLGE